jgi:hypothetical protein
VSVMLDRSMSAAGAVMVSLLCVGSFHFEPFHFAWLWTMRSRYYQPTSTSSRTQRGESQPISMAGIACLPSAKAGRRPGRRSF